MKEINMHDILHKSQEIQKKMAEVINGEDKYLVLIIKNYHQNSPEEVVAKFARHFWYENDLLPNEMFWNSFSLAVWSVRLGLVFEVITDKEFHKTLEQKEIKKLFNMSVISYNEEVKEFIENVKKDNTYHHLLTDEDIDKTANDLYKFKNDFIKKVTEIEAIVREKNKFINEATDEELIEKTGSNSRIKYFVVLGRYVPSDFVSDTEGEVALRSSITRAEFIYNDDEEYKSRETRTLESMCKWAISQYINNINLKITYNKIVTIADRVGRE